MEYLNKNNKINNIKIKKELYKYINLNNYTTYFNKIQRIAQKKYEFSLKILLDDLDENVIFTDKLLKFKEYIKKSLKQMEKYFANNELIMVELLNQDCVDKFYELVKNEINDLIKNKNYEYYLFIKKELHKKLILIYNSYEKSKNINLNKNQKSVLDEFIRNMLKDYAIKLNILKKYNCLNKELISYDDLLYININDTNEIENVLNTINEYNKTYNREMLPSKIIIKENNKYNMCFYKIKNKNNIKQINKSNKFYNNMILFTKPFINKINQEKFNKYIYCKPIYVHIRTICNNRIKEYNYYIKSIKTSNNMKNIICYKYVSIYNKVYKYNIKNLIVFVNQGIG